MKQKKHWRSRGSEGMWRGRRAVVAAVRAGKLPPIKTQMCRCGRQATGYHHHNGYADEHLLDVIPLCTRCHAADDARLRRERKYENNLRLDI